MAMDHAALLEVLDAMKTGDAGERVRVAAETMYQALIETELTATIGAGPWERSPSRSNQRNGSVDRPGATGTSGRPTGSSRRRSTSWASHGGRGSSAKCRPPAH